MNQDLMADYLNIARGDIQNVERDNLKNEWHVRARANNIYNSYVVSDQAYEDFITNPRPKLPQADSVPVVPVDRLQTAVREALEQDIHNMQTVDITMKSFANHMPFTKQLLDRMLAGESI